MAAMNERLLIIPMPSTVADPTITPQLQRCFIGRWSGMRRTAMRRRASLPRDLSHLDQVGVEDRVELRDWQKRKSQGLRKVLYYAGLAMIPVAILLVMFLLAHHGAGR